MRASLSTRLGLALGLALACRDTPPPQQETGPEPVLPDKPLAAGELAPEFRALSHVGYAVSARDFGERPVLVQLCPGGFDTSCTELARSLRSHWLDLNRRLSMALFVVPLGYVEGRAFATTEELPFLVLADTDHSIARAFGVRDATRIGFLLGPGRRISRTLTAASGEDYVRDLSGALP